MQDLIDMQERQGSFRSEVRFLITDTQALGTESASLMYLGSRTGDERILMYAQSAGIAYAICRGTPV
jgi:hypothetical protein